MYWQTENGPLIEIKDMHSKHIYNAIVFINRKLVTSDNFDQKDRVHFAERIGLLENELKRKVDAEIAERGEDELPAGIEYF